MRLNGTRGRQRGAGRRWARPAAGVAALPGVLDQVLLALSTLVEPAASAYGLAIKLHSWPQSAMCAGSMLYF